MYLEVAGGPSAISGASTTGNAAGEVAFRIAPRVMVFGNVGHMRDAQSSSLTTSVNDALSTLADNDLTATGTTKTPAWYSMGGARIQLSNKSAIRPYVLGGVGFARLNPSATFLYQSGTTSSGDVPVPGDDITSDVIASGAFAAPVASTELMFRGGAGVQVPLNKHLLGNVGYSLSRISSASPIYAQDLTFGVGVSF